MNTTFRNAAVFVIAAAIAVIIAAIVFPPGDLFYAKLSSGKSNRLILGTSLAAYGINPHALGPEGLNFAFNMSTSPYGEIYYRAIERKLSSRTDGAFIVEVSPLAVSDMVYYGPEPREASRHLGIIRSVNGHPNIEYLVRGISGSWADSIDPLGSGSTFEYRHEFAESDREAARERVLQFYRQHCSESTPSPQRLGWLRKTVRLLQKNGDVLIVRLPTEAAILELEQAYWPDFWETITQIATDEGGKAIDLSEVIHDAKTADGHHLARSGAETASDYLRNAMARYHTL